MSNDVYCLDFETVFDTKARYGLKNMTTEEYINDPRFKVHGCGYSFNGGPARWVTADKLPAFFGSLELDKNFVLCHNATFDIAILTWKYGFKPMGIFDTLSMARAVVGNEERHGLDALAEKFGLGRKGFELSNSDGVVNLSLEGEKAMAEYCCNDVVLTWKLFNVLAKGFPHTDYKVIDQTIRMFTEPVFELGEAEILRELELVEEKKKFMLERAQCELKDLRSDVKFAEVLRGLGVEPPMKISEKKSKKAGVQVMAYAFSKTDADFKALAESDNELVQFACEARLGLKSTIKGSRAARFKGIYDRMKRLPISLNYYGTSTGRYAAGGAINAQNMPAVRGKDTPDTALLRKSIKAPKGMVVVASDLSQIEARLVVWQAGQQDVLESFAQGRDVYSDMASVIFGRPVDRKKVEADYIPGFIGKCVILGCGYGLGHMKFAGMMYAGMLGGPSVLFDDDMVEMLDVDVDSYVRWVADKKDLVQRLEELKPSALDGVVWLTHVACAFSIINTFREKNPAIPQWWKSLEKVVGAMYRGEESDGDLLGVRKNKLLLPNRLPLYFKDLELNKTDYSCVRKKEGRLQRVKVYGGGVAENCSQALAAIVVKEIMARSTFRPLLQVHDEIVFCVPESEKEDAMKEIHANMKITPGWATGLPLDCETDWGFSYGKTEGVFKC